MSDETQLTGVIQSYILRLWPEGEPGSEVWRVSLTHIPDGQRIGFADLESAFRFLKQQTEPASQWRIP